jgi:pentatricopeptide repeat protein
VVRGCAFDALEKDERAQICSDVADHFSSRPPERYEEARSIEDLTQTCTIFSSLVNAGRLEDACDVWRRMSGTLLHLETHHEIVSLLKPLFPDGFSRPPRIEGPGMVSLIWSDLGIALSSLGRYEEALEVASRVLEIALVSPHASQSVPAELGNLGSRHWRLESPRMAVAGWEWALRVAEAGERADLVSRTHWSLAWHLAVLGQLDEAERHVRELQSPSAPVTPDFGHRGMEEMPLLRLHFERGEWDELAARLEGPDEEFGRPSARRRISFRGELRLHRNDPEGAAEAFGKAVGMGREVGLSVTHEEARLALAQARAGKEGTARAELDRLQAADRPPHATLAEIFLELGEHGTAKEHALEGYRLAWADGPPCAFAWALRRARAVLEALGEEVPELPPHREDEAPPIPCEKEIRELIDRLEEEKAGGAVTD